MKDIGCIVAVIRYHDTEACQGLALQVQYCVGLGFMRRYVRCTATAFSRIGIKGTVCKMLAELYCIPVL
jgi:hypothetical protein